MSKADTATHVWMGAIRKLKQFTADQLGNEVNVNVTGTQTAIGYFLRIKFIKRIGDNEVSMYEYVPENDKPADIYKDRN